MLSVTTIGTATRDVFLESPAFKAVTDPHFTPQSGFPDGEAEVFALGAKIDIDAMTFTTGGGATNAAVTFARQGIKTKCIVKVGNDRIGEDIASELRSENITPVIIKDKTLGSGYATILLSPTGERTVLVYRGASSDIAKDDVPLAKLEADWLYIVPGSISFDVIKRIVSYCRGVGTKIAFNPSKQYCRMDSAKLKLLLSATNVVIANREEAAMITGVDYADERGIFKKFDELVNGIAVMTEGPKGVVVSDGKYIYHAGTFPEEQVRNRTGAGDAFGSGFVAGLIRTGSGNNEDRAVFSQETIRNAIRLASANATSVVEHVGAKAGLLTKDEFSKQRRWKDLDIKTTLL